uniref:Methyltransferase domain-containing protein n=1 Tax=Clastoptera arizonana TaxID=38151 RepID=A0A1B6DAS6_9HEMI
MADTSSQYSLLLNDEEKLKLEDQNSRLVCDFKANKLEEDAKKYWDLFYKRNENRFFKDRHWTTREFQELLEEDVLSHNLKTLLEIGCGVGNFIFPLFEENFNMFIYACDISPRAVELVKSHPKYSEQALKQFILTNSY